MLRFSINSVFLAFGENIWGPELSPTRIPSSSSLMVSLFEVADVFIFFVCLFQNSCALHAIFMHVYFTFDSKIFSGCLGFSRIFVAIFGFSDWLIGENRS